MIVFLKINNVSNNWMVGLMYWIKLIIFRGVFLMVFVNNKRGIVVMIFESESKINCNIL